MVTCALAGSRSDPPRVAYAVGKGVGNAVVRNRVRRRLRAATRAHADALDAGHAYLVSTRAAASTSSYGELASSLHDALRALREDQS